MNILFHSNAPWAATGYGQQTALFAPRFQRDGHQVAISAFWGLQGSIQAWEGMNVFPADEAWGNRTLAAHAAMVGNGNTADVQVITLMDVWVLESRKLDELRIASWVPVDHHPVPPKVKAFFERTAAVPIAMSRFGQEALQDQGLDAFYVPHGVDTTVLKPIVEAKAQKSALGFPDDCFLVGMVAANKGHTPPRKSFPQAFEAFARFRQTHPDAVLYVHSESSGMAAGLNLVALRDLMGIPEDAIRFPPQYDLEMGLFSQEAMAFLYSAMDVLLNPSYGEGFGIPILEAQSCGTPVIVTDWTAMPELCGAGWQVEGDRIYDPTQGAFFKAPSVDGIVDALEQAYKARGTLGVQAREFAEGYDADLVMSRDWAPVLESLDRPREVAALPNRKMRRAAERAA